MALRSVHQLQKEAIGRLLASDYTPSFRCRSVFARITRDLHHNTRPPPSWSAGSFKRLCEDLSEKLNVLSVLFVKQCNAIAAQRMRRAMQILNHYRKLGYDQDTLKNAMERMRQKVLLKKNRPLYALFGASVFQWEQEKITKNEMQE